VRETLGPYVASLTQARKRRAYRLLLAAMIGVFALITWSHYPSYRDDRARITKLESGQISAEQLIGGYGCSGTSCQLIDIHGRPFGPQIPISTPQPGEGQPGEKPGEPVPPISREQIQQYVPDLAAAMRANLHVEAKTLSPRSSLLSGTRSLGTFWGVLFAVFIAATIVGAEWRWGVWRTLLTHEPRRGRMLLAKFATVWTMVALTLAIILGITAGLDAIFRSISGIGTSGGPTTIGLLRGGGKSLLSVEVYATLAAMCTMVIRTSFAGIGSLILLLGDGLATHKWTWLRVALPTQQIARLIPQPTAGIGGTYVWFPMATTGRTECHVVPQGFSVCRETPLTPIPQWRAVAVLFAWIALATAIGWVFLRARDVPQ